MASAASLKEQDSITVITEGGGAGRSLGNSNNPAMYDRASLEKGDSGSITGKFPLSRSLAVRLYHYISGEHISRENPHSFSFRHATKNWQWWWVGRLGS